MLIITCTITLHIVGTSTPPTYWTSFCNSNVNTRWGDKSVAIPPAYMEEPSPHKRPVASRSVILPV
jgi:hypothetical protein